MTSSCIYFLSLTFVIYATLGQLLPQKNGDDAKSKEISRKINFKAAVICSEEGNCTCLFEKLALIVKCTSVGDKFDKISAKLPEKTTHL